MYVAWIHAPRQQIEHNCTYSQHRRHKQDHWPILLSLLIDGTFILLLFLSCKVVPVEDDEEDEESELQDKVQDLGQDEVAKVV